MSLKVLRWTVVCGVSLLFITAPTRADLLNPKKTADTLVHFQGRVDDKALGDAVVGGTVNNWTVFVRQGDFDLPAGGPKNDIVVWGRHNKAVPGHAGEVPNPMFVIGVLQNVVPGVAKPVRHNSVAHGDHFDNLTLFYERIAFGHSRLNINIRHEIAQGGQDPLPQGLNPPAPPSEGTPLPEGDRWTLAAVPAVSEWGMVVVSLLVLTGIVIKFARRRPLTV